MTTRPRDAEEVVGSVVDTDGTEAKLTKRGRRGHPGLFSDELGEKLIKSAQANTSIKSCGEQHGVSYSTLLLWLRKGDEGDPRYYDFAVRFHAARNWLKEKCIHNLIEIADDPTQGAAAVRANDLILRKLYPQEFGDQIFVSTMIRKEADGYDLSLLDHEELRTFMKMLRRLKEGNEDNGGGRHE